MIDKLKDYLVQAVLTKYLPMGGMAALSALGALLLAHGEVLESWGINYIAQWSPAWLTTHAISGPIILIELDTTSTKTLSFIAAGTVILIAAIQHHVTPTVTTKPPAAPPAGLV